MPQYLSWLEINRSAKHVKRTKLAVSNVLNRMRNVKTADDITPLTIEDFKKRRLKEVSPFTVNLELRHFKAFLRRCAKQGWLPSTPLEIRARQSEGSKTSCRDKPPERGVIPSKKIRDRIYEQEHLVVPLYRRLWYQKS